MIIKHLHHRVYCTADVKMQVVNTKNQPIHIIIINNDFPYNSNIRGKSTTSTLIQKPMLFLFLFLLLRKRLSLFAYHNKYIKNVKECRWKCFKQSANRLLIFNTIVTVSFTYFTALHIFTLTHSKSIIIAICLIYLISYYQLIIFSFIFIS